MKRKTTQMTCSRAGQGTAGAKRGRKPRVDIPMEDAQLVEHLCSDASPGGSASSDSLAGMIQNWDPQIAEPCTHTVLVASCCVLTTVGSCQHDQMVSQLSSADSAAAALSGNPDSLFHMSDVCSCQHAQLPALMHVRADVTLHCPKSLILPSAFSRLGALD